MATVADKSNKGSEKGKQLTEEQIIGHFNKLRQDQKAYVTRMTEVEQDLNEHSLVVDALRDVNPDRVCYRMIGGILVERSVKDVLPAVAHNQEQLKKFLDSLTKSVEDKGRELNEFKDHHNIQIRKDPMSSQEPNKDQSQSSSSILVKTES